MHRELILHIGTTKTGSTSIQYVLDGHKKDLLAQGMYWPETPRAKRHLLLALSNANKGHFLTVLGNPVWQGSDPQARIDAYKIEFSREISTLPETVSRVILSAEQFSEMLRTPEEIGRLHAMIRPLFQRIRVIIYLRRQDSHYSSMYAQLLRMGALTQPSLAAVKVGFNFDYDYEDLVGRWAAVFGDDNVEPRLFEAPEGGKFDVVDDFLTACNIDLAISADDRKRARNPSMNLHGQNVLHEVGRQLSGRRDASAGGGGGGVWNLIAMGVEKSSPGTGWLPTRSEAEAFLNRFEKSNDAVRRKWFPDRTSLFNRDFSRLPEVHEVEDAAANFTAACAAMLEVAEDAMRRERILQLKLARVARGSGDAVAAKTALQRVIRSESGSMAARIQLIKLHLQAGDLDAAAGSIAAAERMKPESRAVKRLKERLSELNAKIPSAEALSEAGRGSPPC